jgi:hypothetical protein
MLDTGYWIAAGYQASSIQYHPRPCKLFNLSTFPPVIRQLFPVILIIRAYQHIYQHPGYGNI